jgi:hypothetical protein
LKTSNQLSQLLEAGFEYDSGPFLAPTGCIHDRLLKHTTGVLSGTDSRSTFEGPMPEVVLRHEPISLEEVRAAQRRLEGRVLRSPLTRLNLDDAPAGIYLKLENLQPIARSRFAARPI